MSGVGPASTAILLPGAVLKEFRIGDDRRKTRRRWRFVWFQIPSSAASHRGISPRPPVLGLLARRARLRAAAMLLPTRNRSRHACVRSPRAAGAPSA